MKNGFVKCMMVGSVLAISSGFPTEAEAFSFSDLKNIVANSDKEEISAKQEADDKRNVQYTGYSKDFQKVKKLIAKGKASKAYDLQQKKIEKSKDEPGLLVSLEQGLIALDADKRKESKKHFTHAENILKARSERSRTRDASARMGSIIGSGLGFGEAGEYEGEAYERILMLNYKTIAYMLDGDSRAYNVTKRAIDWQNREKKAFDKNLAATKKEIQKKENEQKKGQDVKDMNLFSVISSQYKQSEKKALQVPSSFVNPFGFYMAGVVNEYNAYKSSKKSLKSNAKISYKKALKLNPDSKVLKQAVKDIEKKSPKDKRFVNIIVADGFAPEKKLLTFNFAYMGSIVPIKLPLYETVDSAVDRIEVQNGKGEPLTDLQLVADIDAIALRHQFDSLPKQHLQMTMDVARSVFESKKLSEIGVLGTFIKNVREKTSNPDMRAWMSMPKKLMAARLYLPKNAKSITLVSYNKKGKILAKKKMKLNAENHNFIYARTIDKVIYTNQSEKMWVKL